MIPSGSPVYQHINSKAYSWPDLPEDYLGLYRVKHAQVLRPSTCDNDINPISDQWFRFQDLKTVLRELGTCDWKIAQIALDFDIDAGLVFEALDAGTL